MKTTRAPGKRAPFEVTRSALGGLLLIVGLGVALTTLRLGAPLGRLSYDLPFCFLARPAPTEAVMVYINSDTRKALGLKDDERIPRARHAELLERLTRDGARVVYYDILFAKEEPDPAGDTRFVSAITAHGQVVLGAEQHPSLADSGVVQDTVEKPAPLFKNAANAWGLSTFSKDPDNAIRRLPPPTPDVREADRLVAELYGSSAHHAQGQDTVWLRYYGPTHTLESVSFQQALYEDGVPPGIFKNRIVCIGGQDEKARNPIFGEDEFGNPWSRWGDAFSPGLDIHTTMSLNLVRGDWLTRPSALAEGALAALLGVIAWVIFYSITPLRGALVVVLAGLAIFLASLTLQIHSGIWWNWLVPAAVQFPAALIWSVTTRYASEARKRAHLRDAFAFYLSPQMADRIAREDTDLKPGGKKTVATVVFTDIQDFTRMSEELKDPELISQTLIAYFTETSRHVLDNDGTIIKFVGDAVFACWNAPIADPDHAVKALRAAWGVAQAAQEVVKGRVLHTRVGVSTGEVLAGNLGSPSRFDYTCIGNPVNLASRLEGLNKYLGTRVLIAEGTRVLLGDRFLLRPLGSFVVAGQSEPVAIHELLGPEGARPADLAWLATWEQAMQALREGDFAAANKHLRKVIWQRNGTDGPSEYYLTHLADLEKEGHLAAWTGVVKVKFK